MKLHYFIIQKRKFLRVYLSKWTVETKLANWRNQPGLFGVSIPLWFMQDLQFLVGRMGLHKPARALWSPSLLVSNLRSGVTGVARELFLLRLFRRYRFHSFELCYGRWYAATRAFHFCTGQVSQCTRIPADRRIPISLCRDLHLHKLSSQRTEVSYCARNLALHPFTRFKRSVSTFVENLPAAWNASLFWRILLLRLYSRA